MGVEIRMATTADLPQLLALFAELQPDDPPIDNSLAETVFEKAVKNGVRYFVAVDERRIVGSCFIAIIPNLTRRCSSIGFIENVVTATEYRRRGIGRILLNAATQYAKQQGCYKVALQSGVKRTDAHKFYESVGFDGDSKRAFEIRFE
ncbi:MAG: GNAT family N-acetyltransferase [Clostridiales bacterium]|jgi:GNAT superfamily N-acetyltransferase|nr:GNAT family N-acetyltransferase [Clostridiales bacterium]